MFEILLLVIALSIDAFITSLAYGAGQIKIPFKSAIALSGISAVILTISLGLGQIAAQTLSRDATRYSCFTILMLLGISRFFEGIFKKLLQKQVDKAKGIYFKCWDFHFILEVYADNTKADKDHSKSLSVKEAISLGIVLSLDGIGAGFGNGLVEARYIPSFLLALGIGFVAIVIGAKIGRKIAQNSPIDISWVSGIVLMVLAVLKLF